MDARDFEEHCWDEVYDNPDYPDLPAPCPKCHKREWGIEPTTGKLGCVWCGYEVEEE